MLWRADIQQRREAYGQTDKCARHWHYDLSVQSEPAAFQPAMERSLADRLARPFGYRLADASYTAPSTAIPTICSLSP